MIAQTNPITKAAVFGVQDTVNGRVFAVLKYRYSVVNNEPKWEARRYQMSEQDLVKAIASKSTEFINVDIKNNRVVQRGASFDRFKKLGNAQIVIGVMTVNRVSGYKVIGYRVVFKTGMIKAVKLQDVVNYAVAAQNKGLVPFQNAMFVQGKDQASQFLRAYNEGDFITESHVYTAKANQVVDSQNTPKDLKEHVRHRASDIYTPEQLKELRTGKREDLPIKIYANPKLSAEQMKALREALEKGINPSRYASPEYEAKKMRFFTFQLSKHNRINEYLNPAYSYPQLVRLAQAVQMGLNVKTLLNPKMSVTEMDDEIVHLELQTYNNVEPVEGKSF